MAETDTPEHQLDNITVPAADAAGIGAQESEAQGNTNLDVEHGIRKRSPFGMFAIMAALFLSMFVAALDATIVATAIPTIASQLHSASGYTWIGGAYLLGDAASGPVRSPKPPFLAYIIN